MPRELEAAIAANRFGLGAAPGELTRASADPRGWLRAQIRGEGADQPDSDGDSAAERMLALRQARREQREGRLAAAETEPAMAESGGVASVTPAPPLRRVGPLVRGEAGGDFVARLRLATTTPASFRERWALFFANHLTVSGVKQATASLVGPFEQEAVRPHVFGRFETLLVASTRHPAMLAYLDQAQSVGPGSPAGQRGRAAGRRSGLNENLAREILELHTVGVGAGYTQTDVTELAKALTGWSVGGQGGNGMGRGAMGRGGMAPGRRGRARRVVSMQGEEGGFAFRAVAHEPGARRVMGRDYGEGDEAQATAVLQALASDPRTARHVCTKLARHFVADDPPPSLVARLERAWLDGGGALDQVAAALIEAPEAWEPAPRKFKTPYEFVVSSWRATDGGPALDAQRPQRVAAILTSLGQRPFGAPSPRGWSDQAATWAAPDAIVKRLGWAQAYAATRGPRLDPVVTAREALGPLLSPAVADAVRRAESRPEALAVLLMSPEFQRR